MVPTLGVYDRILVQKAFFTRYDVREADIVVFSHPPLGQCTESQPTRPAWLTQLSGCYIIATIQLLPHGGSRAVS
jgi:hypothetical protein